MTARAIWKGVLVLDELRLPVRLYAAVADRAVHFRMLHADDHQPLEQRLVNPRTDEPVPREALRRAREVRRGRFVVITEEELAATRPEFSRDIALAGFVSPGTLSHAWYDRPYWLGPDGAPDDYFALARALEQEGREGLAQWVMRGQRYSGALRARDGYLSLVTLRHADQVVPAAALEPPAGRDFERRELAMARKLVATLEGDFEPQDYHDEHRRRLLDLIAAKARGESVAKPRETKRPPSKGSLSEALEQSLEEAG